jgi:DNA-binding CsgD family transcriptional regulator
MRHVTFVVVPEEEGLHPATEALESSPSVSRDTILHLNLLSDGTAVALNYHRGDPEALREILVDCADVLRHDVTAGNPGIEAYVHFRPNKTAAALLWVTNEFELIVETPIKPADKSGAIRVGVIGPDDVVQRAIDYVPDTVQLELERLSDYEAGSKELMGKLTERQREILTIAIEIGYYDVPRQATHQNIADVLGLSTTTVGEHLRKIEANLFSDII